MTFLRLVSHERPLSDYQSSDIDHLSDAELLNQPCNRPSLTAEAGVTLHDNNITRWTNGTVAKTISRSPHEGTVPEAYAMDLVFHHTSIPVPRVRRVIIRQSELPLLFMDYIPGRQLVHVWPTMSLFAKLRIAFVLRRYIRQLRAIRHPRLAVPGPPVAGLDGVRGRTVLNGEVRPLRGPFNTYAEYAAFWNDHHRFGKMPHATAEAAAVLEPFDDSAPLVLTHGDLNMCNILVGDDGRLWLIDWDFAGFYPPWFEFVGLRYVNWFDWAKQDAAGRLWSLCIPFICGPYYKQEWWRRNMGCGLDYGLR